ncbi:hypothetical protein [Nocardioides speluncae]|uniref:hypothetical protein n=1 Tax=Nocardioides speluncae TaxID=2670337 RepID=UPI000D68B477|nr:hypothetical protein [Nocardioides speluncae]
MTAATVQSATDWLAAKQRSYFADARRLREMHEDDAPSDDMTWEQWSIVYRTVADELAKCAAQITHPRPEATSPEVLS